MLTADYVALIAAAVVILSGVGFGFGKVLTGIVSGVPGKISSAVITYFLWGVALDLPFVKDLMSTIVEKLTANGNFLCKILLAIRLDMIAIAVGLFLLVYFGLRMLAMIVSGITESENKGMRVLNKVGGALLMLAYVSLFALTLFQLSAWIFGTDGGLYPYLKGSKLWLDQLYIHNPLNSIFETIKHSVSGLVG